jgi:arylsulfatase A-like enzyme
MYPRYSSAFNKELLPATWPTSFKKVGYRTFWTGKWNTFGRPADFGIDETSRVFKGGMGSHKMTFVEDGKKVTGFSSELFADAAIRFLKTVSENERPFFATVAFTAPHDPRTPPPLYKQMYDPSTISAPPSFMPVHPFDDGYFNIRDEKLLPRPRDRDEVAEEIAAYYGMITHMDDQIGRILDALDATGKRKNTLIIYLGDHGLALGNHGLLGKMSMYSHSTETPLIIAGPGIPKGEVRDALAYLHDLFPTTCSLAGIPVPDSVEGLDLSPVIRGERKDVRDYIYCANSNLQRMVRDQRYKLMRFYRDEKRKMGSNRYAFFDLVKDPHELHDLIDAPKHQKRIADFKDRLAEWQERMGDPFR